MSVNKVILIGNVGRDPETKVVGNTKIATFSLATGEYYKDANGQKQERVDWHNVSVFGKVADFVEKFVKKGSQLFVEGRIRYSKSGETYYTNIAAEKVEFVGSKKEPQDKEPQVPQDAPGTDDLPFRRCS